VYGDGIVSSNWSSPFYYVSPDEVPTPFNIPTTFRQNETPSWEDPEYQDVNGNLYSSQDYTLTYWIAGPSSAPVSIVATPATNSTGWQSAITPTQAALLVPGNYWWQAILTAPADPSANPPTLAFKLVGGEGQLVVQVDYSSVTGVYDGRTTAQIGLAACENALSVFTSSQGLIKRYTIGGRSMEFQDVQQIIDLMAVWRQRVQAELDTADGGRSRKLLVRWSHAH
jgi:hypothetical protein